MKALLGFLVLIVGILLILANLGIGYAMWFNVIAGVLVLIVGLMVLMKKK
jgi:hypothetical protein